MPGTGSYGTPSSVLYSEYRNTVGELLTELPNNTAHSIVAQNIRDSVWTLWNRIDDVGIIAASAASASSFYTNPSSVPVTVGGIIAGTSFPGNYTMQEMFDRLLYPYIAPGAALSFSGNPRQYGDSAAVSLNWTATKNTNSITSITVDGVPQIPTGNTQVGVKAAIGTHSLTPAVSQTNTFNMSDGDGVQTTNTSTSLTWMNNRYWGYIDLTSIGNPDLTSNPGLSASVAAYVTDTRIKAMTGANANAQLFGHELSTTKSKTYTGINGAGKHLVFAWPSNVAGALTPTFTVNGLPSTAFTRVRSNSVFVNEEGFSGTNFEVWVSNTLQNSPLNIVIS